MPRVECSGCGSVLAVPDDLKEGAAFTCARCGLIARNVDSTRRFRWAELDPYIRKHGVSRANLWGGLIGSVAWIPALAIVLYVTGFFDIGLLLALAGPYLLMLAVLKQRRARTPAALWASHFWIGMGAYFLYLFALVSLFPLWAGVILDVSGTNRSVVARWMLATMGISAVLTGAGLTWLYRVRARRLPRAVPRDAPGAPS